MKRKVGIMVALFLLLMNFTYAVEFTDVEGHWAKANIESLAEKGVINGYPDGTFKPEGAIKKGEFIKLMMVSALPEVDWNNTTNFIEHWAGSYIAIAEAKNILEYGEYNDTNADDEITRAEVVEILGKCDILLKGKKQKNIGLEFTDISGMSEEQKAMLQHVVYQGLITGYEDATFKPERTLTRAEVATILVRYMK